MIRKELIQSDRAAAPVASYSQGWKVGHLVFLAGQVGRDPATGQIVRPKKFTEAPIEAQTIQVIENMKALLEVAGTSLEHVISTNIYLTDMKDFYIFNEVYGRYFKPPYPARTTVKVSGLAAPEMLVEIQCVAYVP